MIPLFIVAEESPTAVAHADNFLLNTSLDHSVLPALTFPDHRLTDFCCCLLHKVAPFPTALPAAFGLFDLCVPAFALPSPPLSLPLPNDDYPIHLSIP